MLNHQGFIHWVSTELMTLVNVSVHKIVLALRAAYTPYSWSSLSDKGIASVVVTEQTRKTVTCKLSHTRHRKRLKCSQSLLSCTWHEHPRISSNCSKVDSSAYGKRPSSTLKINPPTERSNIRMWQGCPQWHSMSDTQIICIMWYM